MRENTRLIRIMLKSVISPSARSGSMPRLSTPLLALLDLLDNCFDAATMRNTGRIYIDVNWLDTKSNQLLYPLFLNASADRA